MKLDKYLLWFQQANATAAKRLHIPALPAHQLAVLMIIKRAAAIRYSVIQSKLKQLGKTHHDSYISRSLNALLSSGLIQRSNHLYTITPSGREYLSSIRQFLLNKRL
jgi:DNA-binding PadR family transcriptional regulator